MLAMPRTARGSTVSKKGRSMTETVDREFRDSVQEAEAFRSPYELWKSDQGIPTLTGYYVENCYTQELVPWKERGGSGIFVNLEGTGGFNDTYLYELAPKEESKPV